MNDQSSQPAEDAYRSSEPDAKLGQKFDSHWVEVMGMREAMSSQTPPVSPPREVRRRRHWLPLVLFVLTCVSTFYSGANFWAPFHYFMVGLDQGSFMPARRTMLHEWPNGLIYMGCLLAILLTHEMGHFVASWLHRVPASFPYFLPIPFHPIGTLGAVIAMDGSRANRKEIFDIGIAGPIAGLLVAVPIFWFGIQRLDFNSPEIGPIAYELPLGAKLLLNWLRPAGYEPGQDVFHGQLNPFFMAGWLGMLVTGLNMMPVSQLDGGHVIYALLRRRAHQLARLFLGTAVGYMVFQLITTHTPSPWTLMLILVSLIGVTHPPTQDDSVPLGAPRLVLGWLSLLIPVFCFPVHGMRIT